MRVRLAGKYTARDMKLEQFAMERMQSTYENLVEFNLSESGVRPLTPRELVEDPAGLEGLLDQPLVYTQSNGTIGASRGHRHACIPAPPSITSRSPTAAPKRTSSPPSTSSSPATKS